MRILHVIAAVADVYGGPPRVAQQMCRTLAARGHDVTLLTTDASFGTRLDVPLNRPVHREGYMTWYAPCRISSNPHISLRLAWCALRAAGRFDVAHVHGLFNFPATISQLLFRLRDQPYVVRPCGLLNRYGLAHKATRKRLALALVESRNVAAAGIIQASSMSEAADLRALGFDHVHVLPQGVETRPARASSPPLAGPYVLFVGRLAPVKGLPRLVRAFARLQRPDFQLVLAGPDENGHRVAVEHAARQAGIRDRVTFTGMITGDEKSRYLSHARVFVLASDSESFGIAAIEAAGHGIPLLVTTGVGVAHDIAETHAGVVVEPTEEAIARGLEQLLADRESFVRGTRDLSGRYTWERATERLEMVYEALRTGATANEPHKQGRGG